MTNDRGACNGIGITIIGGVETIDGIRASIQVNMITSGPRAVIQRLVQRDGDVVECELISFVNRGIILRGRARSLTSSIVLNAHVNIAADSGVGERGLHLAQFRFVCADGGSHADSSDGGETQCPFIKLHLFLRCCLVVVVLLTLTRQKQFAPAPKGALEFKTRENPIK